MFEYLSSWQVEAGTLLMLANPFDELLNQKFWLILRVSKQDVLTKSLQVATELMLNSQLNELLVDLKENFISFNIVYSLWESIALISYFWQNWWICGLNIIKD